MAEVTADEVYPWKIQGVMLWDSNADWTADGHVLCCVDYVRGSVRHSCGRDDSFNVSLGREGDECPSFQGWNSAIGGCVDIRPDQRMSCLLPNANLISGRLGLIEKDLEVDNQIPVSRYYVQDQAGSGWKWEFTQHLSIAEVVIPGTDDTHVVAAIRANGTSVQFRGAVVDGFRTDSTAGFSLRALTGADGAITGWRLQRGDTVIETYNPAGQLGSVSDGRGRTATVEFDLAGRPALLRDQTGVRVRITYLDEKVSEIKDVSGRTWRYIYGQNGKLAEVVFPDSTPLSDVDNPRRRYVYGQPGSTQGSGLPDLLLSVFDQRGVRTREYEYELDGKLVAIAGSEGASRTTIQYQPANVRVLTDSLGYQTSIDIVTSDGAALIRSITGDDCGCGL